MCETEINTNYRYGRTEPKDNFYPNVGDFVDWTQEKNVSIREPNTFFYNPTYSKVVSTNIYRTLPYFFSQEEFDCRYDSPNGVMYSQPDYSENDLVDPWLVFKPLDRYEFPTSYGKLIDLVGVQDEQIMARFEDQKALFNAFDTLVDDGQTPQKRNLGSGGIFARRPKTFSKADLGVLGTQHTEYVLTPYGLFDVDAKRGKVYHFDGQGMNEISSFINGKPSGMRNWFREHLPFKILKTHPNADVDNKFKSLGISMGWDSRFDRVFITKKDYIPLNNNICYKEGEFRISQGPQVDALINEQVGLGYTYKGIEDCRLKFTKEESNITDATDIFAFFDTTSMQVQDGIDAAEALSTWFSNYQMDNPNYEGNLYIIPYGRENYLSFPYSVQIGSISPTGGQWQNIQILPPNLGTSQWVPPTDLLLLAFVDETHSQYHGTQTQGFTYSDQPKLQYISDFDVFKNTVYPQYNFFRGVLYPIVQSLTGAGGGLVLQAMAAIKGTTWTQSEIDATGTQVDVSLLLTENPYENYEYDTGKFLEPLEDYGWTGFYDKTSPASEVFNSQQFQDDLNSYINPGGEQTNVETLYIDLPSVSLQDPTYFKDVSWTIAYKPIDGQWVSYYSFHPDIYVNHHDYFQTGLNYSATSSEIGLWSHLLTNRSYNVFYGKKYPFILEVPFKNENVNKLFQSAEIYTEAKRFDNSYGFSVNRYITFNKAVIYNNTNNSGLLNLVPQKNNLVTNSKYPITNSDNTQDILITSQDEEWNINYFYNRMKDDDNNIPMWIKDTNDIDKTINQKAVSFYGKKVLERFRGDWAILRLIYDKDSRYNLMYKMGITDEQAYD